MRDRADAYVVALGGGHQPDVVGADQRRRGCRRPASPAPAGGRPTAPSVNGIGERVPRRGRLQHRAAARRRRRPAPPGRWPPAAPRRPAGWPGRPAPSRPRPAAGRRPARGPGPWPGSPRRRRTASSPRRPGPSRRRPPRVDLRPQLHLGAARTAPRSPRPAGRRSRSAAARSTGIRRARRSSRPPGRRSAAARPGVRPRAPWPPGRRRRRRWPSPPPGPGHRPSRAGRGWARRRTGTGQTGSSIARMNRASLPAAITARGRGSPRSWVIGSPASAVSRRTRAPASASRRRIGSASARPAVSSSAESSKIDITGFAGRRASSISSTGMPCRTG